MRVSIEHVATGKESVAASAARACERLAVVQVFDTLWNISTVAEAGEFESPPPANSAMLPTEVAVMQGRGCDRVATLQAPETLLKISTRDETADMLILPPANRARLPTVVAAKLSRACDREEVLHVVREMKRSFERPVHRRTAQGLLR